MNCSKIPSGASIFVDANVMVYDFGPDPTYGPPCKAFLQRIARQDLRGFTSTLCFHDFAYRAMTVEAYSTFGWSYTGIGRRLKDKPAEIRKLHRFRTALDVILLAGIIVLPVTAEDILRAAEVSLDQGLLSGDALIVAMMHANGLVNIASADADFDRVPGILRYSPL